MERVNVNSPASRAALGKHFKKLARVEEERGEWTTELRAELEKSNHKESSVDAR